MRISFLCESNKIKILNLDQNLRSYIYLKDAIQIIINIMFFGKQNVYNVGGVNKVNILNLAKIIAKILKVKITLPKKNKNIGSPKHPLTMDTTAYYKEFKKIKLTPFEYGIKKTIGWNKKYE